jgi:hypothetical protein
MSSAEKLAMVEEILTRVAEDMGDITQAVFALYYQRLPEARERFQFHAQGNIANLEGEMVAQALYCLMTWFESPGEIEILLLGSVPHHKETLHIPTIYYRELINATAEVVEQSIPPENSEELNVWGELRRALQTLVDDSAEDKPKRID